jgi:hypothetical protein
MQPITDADKKAIIVGRPMPFSIYSAERKLLLAAGRLVPNEFVRESMLRSGAFAGGENAGQSIRGANDADEQKDELDELRSRYQHTAERQQIGFRMEREGAVYRTRVVGVSENGSGLMMSGPLTMEGVPAKLREGESWTFRALYSTAAVRFNAVVSAVSTQPFSYFCASQLTDIERRSVRRWPRTATALDTARKGEVRRIIVDLSVGGARVAAKHQASLQQGQSLLLSPMLQLDIGIKPMSLDATVINLYGSSDPRHPRIDFYGVQFEKVAEPDRVILHAYVQEHLHAELDRLWHVLAGAAH